MDITTGSPAFIILSAADIAERAYQLYLERGRVDGFDREDWLRAEHELTMPRKKNTRARS
jgi:Protein of unknown function (DUF2934)